MNCREPNSTSWEKGRGNNESILLLGKYRLQQTYLIVGHDEYDVGPPPLLLLPPMLRGDCRHPGPFHVAAALLLPPVLMLSPPELLPAEVVNAKLALPPMSPSSRLAPPPFPPPLLLLGRGPTYPTYKGNKEQFYKRETKEFAKKIATHRRVLVRTLLFWKCSPFLTDPTPPSAVSSTSSLHSTSFSPPLPPTPLSSSSCLLLPPPDEAVEARAAKHSSARAAFIFLGEFVREQHFILSTQNMVGQFSSPLHALFSSLAGSST